MAVDEDLATLQSVLSGLSKMSEDITDPSRHEKLLSFLQSNAEKGPSMVHYMIAELNALSIINDCLKHSDYRVHSLSHLVANDVDKGNIFDAVRTGYPDILEFVISTLQSSTSPAPLKYGCLEMMRLCSTSHGAAAWLLDIKCLLNIVLRAFSDTNLYVMESVCSLLVALINRTQPSHASRTDPIYDTLLQTLLAPDGLYSHLQRWLLPTSSFDSKLAALELLWRLAETKSMAAWHFMRNGLMIKECCKLLTDTDRIVQARVIDILICVFTWAPSPVDFLRNNDSTTVPTWKAEEQPCQSITRPYPPASDAFHHIRDTTLHSLATQKQPATMAQSRTLLSAIFGTLRILAALARRSQISQDVDWLVRVLARVGEVLVDFAERSGEMGMIVVHVSGVEGGECAANIVQQVQALIAKETGPRRNMNIRTTLMELCRAYGEVLEAESGTMQPFLALAKRALLLDDIMSDVRLVQIILGVCLLVSRNLTLLENSPEDFVRYQQLFDIFCICLDQGGTQSQVVKLALEGIVQLFHVDEFMRRVSGDKTHSENFVRLLTGTVRSSIWDVRDTGLWFIAGCFEKGSEGSTSSAISQFAVNHNFPTLAVESLLDEGPYVRASALLALQRIMQTPVANQHLHAVNQYTNIMRTVVTLLSDSEAFVRRAAVEFVIAFINVDGEEELFGKGEGKIGREQLQRILEDVDWEVRARGVELLGALSSVNDNVEDGKIWEMGGNELISKMASDPSRVVRIQAHDLITKIINTNSQQPPSGNSSSDPPSSKRRRLLPTQMADLVDALGKLDLNALKQSTVAEHLYQEALDVDRSVMEELVGRNEGNNVLECYDC
ncbi:BRCA1-associated ATM activator 1 [Rhizophlyctis rosea]|nr:BRCA1-associated ATM activator 1 [Rhizophlyctis rosea]